MAVSDLKWVEEEKDPGARPNFDEFEVIGQRSFKELIIDKCTENLIVPMGLLATTACLTMGLINMRKGDANKQQLFMRGRVGFQAVTLAAMAIGMYATQKKRVNKKKAAATTTSK